MLGEIGGLQAAVTQQEAMVERLAGDPGRGGRLRAGYESWRRWASGRCWRARPRWLAHALLAQGLAEEAERFCASPRRPPRKAAPAARRSAGAESGPGSRGAGPDGGSRGAGAGGRAAGGRVEFPTLHADALRDLGEVLCEAGRSDEAEAAAQALELYRRKGDVVSPTNGGIRDQVHDRKLSNGTLEVSRPVEPGSRGPGQAPCLRGRAGRRDGGE